MTSSSSHSGRAILALAAAALLLGCGASSKTARPPVKGLAQRQVQFEQVVYPFYVFVPSSFDGSHPAPAILLIHGFGGRGTDMIGLWQNFAEQNGIILVGPTLPLGGNFETAVALQLYPIIMDSV